MPAQHRRERHGRELVAGDAERRPPRPVRQPARIASTASAVAGAPQGTPMHSCRNGGAAKCPCSTMRFASATWPRSNTSSSGFTPAPRISRAMVSRWADTLTMACAPKFMVATSRLQMSGRSASTCSTRSSGADQGGAGAGLARIVGLQAGAGAGGQVDQHVAAGVADAGHHLPVQLQLAAGLAGGGVADVDVPRPPLRPPAPPGPPPRSARGSRGWPGSWGPDTPPALQNGGAPQNVNTARVPRTSALP